MNDHLATITLERLFHMRTLAMDAVDAEPHQVREDAFTAALYAARAGREALGAQVDQVRTRTALALDYMEGKRGKHPLSASAAETAAGRDPEYLRAKERTADLVQVAEVAAAIARDLAALAGIPAPLPPLSLAAQLGIAA